MRTGRPAGSKRPMGLTPHLPWRAASQTEVVFGPSAFSEPMPLITVRRDEESMFGHLSNENQRSASQPRSSSSRRGLSVAGGAGMARSAARQAEQEFQFAREDEVVFAED